MRKKNLSQGDVEKLTGLFRCYISRVENGYTVPSLETIEKFARALEVPLYQIFYDGEQPPAAPHISKRKGSEEAEWGYKGKDARLVEQLRQLMGRTSEANRKLLLLMAQKMARGNTSDRLAAD